MVQSLRRSGAPKGRVGQKRWQRSSLFARRLSSEVGIDPRRRIRAGEEANEQWLSVERLQTFLDLGEQLFGDAGSQDDFAGWCVSHVVLFRVVMQL